MDTAYNFWQRVDEVRGSQTLMEICEAISLPYSTLRNQRSENRYPKRKDIDLISEHLKTTTEYLLTGLEGRLSISATMEYVQKNKRADWIISRCMEKEQMLSILYAFVQCLEKEGI